MGKKPDYKIGLLARMFAVAPGTIRNYEDKGILVSRRAERSTTRRYYARNVKLLFTIRKYLSMGFQIEDVKKLFSCETVRDMDGLMSDKQEELEERIVRIRENLRALRESRELIAMADRLCGKCEMAVRPEMLLIINQAGQEIDESGETVENVRRMNGCLPFVYPASVVPARAILNNDEPQTRLSGFCVCAGALNALDTLSGRGVTRLPSAPCLHTVLTLSFTPMPNMSELFAKCIDYMNENSLELAGDAVGRDIMQTGEKQCLQVEGIDDAYRPKALYYEYWLPVKKK